jgi:hypothetical protein
MPDAAGGEGGHGAAKPEGVIHRCRDHPEYEDATSTNPARFDLSSKLQCLT